MSIDEFFLLKHELIEQGYQRYINPIDAEAAAENPCPNCDCDRCYGIGYKKPGVYLAFQICPHCGFVSEF